MHQGKRSCRTSIDVQRPCLQCSVIALCQHMLGGGGAARGRHQKHAWLLGCMHAGKLILETDTALAKAPDGNGGVYLALARSGALAHMKEHVSDPRVASKARLVTGSHRV